MARSLKISQLIGSPNATSREDGTKVFEEALKLINAGFSVELDFGNISALISRFLHASVGKLRKQLGDAYAAKVKVSNFPRPTWQTLYDDAIELASNPEIGKARASALSAAYEA